MRGIDGIADIFGRRMQSTALKVEYSVLFDFKEQNATDLDSAYAHLVSELTAAVTNGNFTYTHTLIHSYTHTLIHYTHILHTLIHYTHTLHTLIHYTHTLHTLIHYTHTGNFTSRLVSVSASYGDSVSVSNVYSE